eukprot:323053_1
MIHHLMFLIFAYSNQIGNSWGPGEWRDSTWDEYPFMVRFVGYSDCSGSILSLNGHNGKGVVLTAAHCAGPTTVAIGDTTYNVGSRTIHENFVGEFEYPYANDIALIYLTQAITHPSAEQVVLQNNDNLIRYQDEVLITQHGSGNTLQVALSHKNTCDPSGTYPEGGFCIQDYGGMDNMESSVCFGDLGSPLIHNGKQIGMVGMFGWFHCNGDPQY